MRKKGQFLYSLGKYVEANNLAYAEEASKTSVFGLEVAAERTPSWQITDNLNSPKAIGSYYNALNRGKISWRITPAIKRNRLLDSILSSMGDKKIKVTLDESNADVKRYLIDNFGERLDWLKEQAPDVWRDVKNPVVEKTIIWGMWELGVAAGIIEGFRIVVNEAIQQGDDTAKEIAEELSDNGIWI